MARFAVHGNVDTAVVICKPSLVALVVTFIVGVSPLMATLLFSQQQEKSKQKSAIRDVFYS